MKIKYLIIFLLFIELPLVSQSFGTTVYSFLNMNYSARSQGLSGNLGLYGGDVDVQLDNPAALLGLKTDQISASYNKSFLDFSGGYLGYFPGHYKWGSMAVGIIYFDYGDFAETDEFGQTTGSTFGAVESALILSYAKPLEFGINLGVNLKIINSSLADRSSWGIAGDFAFDYRPSFLNNGIIFLMFKNLGGQLSGYYDEKESLPFSLQLGASHKPQHLPITLGFLLKDLNYASDNFGDRFLRFVISAEYSSRTIALRLGYDNDKRMNTSFSGTGSIGGISLGFGVNYKMFRFDYAISLMNSLGNTHRFGVIWNM